MAANLPLVIVETSGRTITNSIKAPGRVTVIGTTNGYRTLFGPVEYCGDAGISIRGSSSSAYPKKPYRLELQDEGGDDLKVSLLGMPKESDWILYASYGDKTFIRDVLAYELWRAMGHYGVRTRYVELFVITNSSRLNGESVESSNGEHPHPGPLPGMRENLSSIFNLLSSASSNEYRGVYVLMEKIKRGKDRVNIKKLDAKVSTEPNITGGYLFKKDRLNEGERGFKTRRGIEFAFEEPKERDITPAQVRWLTNYLNEFEAALFGPNFLDPEKGYRNYIDVDSFIDYHWMAEMSWNIDAFWFSQFYHKDRGGKLKMGPIWDWDLSFGNSAFLGAHKTNGWEFEQIGKQHYQWFERLFQDPDFLQRYIDRWSELRTNVFATSNILARIDRFAAQLSEAQERNYKRWPTLMHYSAGNFFAAKTYMEHVNRLKTWIEGRLAWIDSQDFPKPNIVINKTEHGIRNTESSSRAENVQRSTSNVQRSIEVTMSCAVGKIYYTLDGSDPRLPGGSISTNALEYTAPVSIPKQTRLIARVRSDYSLWSAPAVVNSR